MATKRPYIENELDAKIMAMANLRITIDHDVYSRASLCLAAQLHFMRGFCA